MAAIPQTVSVDVSRSGLIRSARDQFTSSFTFLTELMQNARRAGASKVEITFDEAAQELRVADDGNGIADPSALLTLGKSGWENLDELAAENPYGVGFSAALFASNHIRVESRSWVIDADTADLLAFASVEVSAHPATVGTRITLSLRSDLASSSSLQLNALQYVLEQAAFGFPIPVWLNGDALERPFAQAALEGFETPYGFVSYRFDPRSPMFDPVLYLQGLPVKRNYYRVDRRERECGIVHLESSMFRARMPDRDQLIDGSAKLKALDQIIAEKWRETIRAAKTELEPVEFARNWTKVALHYGCPELLDDLPLARQAWGTYNRPLGQSRWPGDAGCRALQAAFSTADSPDADMLNSRENVIWMLDEDVFYDDIACTEGASLASAFAVELGWPAVDPDMVRTAAHWAAEAIDLNEAELQIASLENERPAVSFSAHNVAFDVICCDHYTVESTDPRLPDLTITEVPCFRPDSHELIVPKAGFKYLEDMLLQVSDYLDENESFMEALLDEDLRDLTNLVQFAFSEDSAQLLLALIQRAAMGIGLTPFAGQKFHVDFDTPNGVPAITQAS